MQSSFSISGKHLTQMITKIMLSKLRCCGIACTAHVCFHLIYPIAHSMAKKMKILSQAPIVLGGIPQGSILGLVDNQ